MLKTICALSMVGTMLVFAAACSSSSSSDTTPESTISGSHLSTAVPSVSVSQVTQGSTSSSDYTAYVSQVCRAAKQFKNDLSKSSDSLPGDPSQALDQAGQAFSSFSSALQGINPPSDLQAWQQDLVNRLDTIGQGLQDRDVSTLGQAFNNQFPPIPDATRNEVSKAVKSSPDCDNTSVFSTP